MAKIPSYERNVLIVETNPKESQRIRIIFDQQGWNVVGQIFSLEQFVLEANELAKLRTKLIVFGNISASINEINHYLIFSGLFEKISKEEKEGYQDNRKFVMKRKLHCVKKCCLLGLV